MPTLPLSPDELLSTTRAVRRRLDLSRPVEREVLEECLTLAQQAPTGSNAQGWHFVVVSDPDRRRALADIYRRAWDLYAQSPFHAGAIYQGGDSSRQATQERVLSSADYLAQHLHECPVHVIPCIEGRLDNATVIMGAARWGSIIPAAWSFMLAARSRGLGTSLTTLHLFFEQEAAEVLGIPYESVTQAGLIPVAYTQGTDFKPAPREPVSTITHWDTW